MSYLILLTVALAVTQLLDWYSTRTIINRGGRERNWVMAALFDEFGMDEVLCVKAVAVTAVGCWLGAQLIEVLAALVVFYIGILIYNWRSMPK